MKRFLALILSALMITASLAIVPVNAATSGDWGYTVSDGKAAINRYYGSATAVTIPCTIGGYPVTALSYWKDSDSFRGIFYNKSVTSVTISDSVTTIGNSAFYGCKGLTSITIPSGVTSIGEFAFSGCSGLTSVTIPSSVTSIGMYAFRDCTGLTSIAIPNSVTSIGHSTFYGCTGLTSFIIPASVTSIESCTFYNCRGLTSVTIASSVTSISTHAFDGCSDLTVSFGNDVTAVRDYLFQNVTAVKRVNIGENVTTIGQYAFQGTGLTELIVPEGVTKIGYNAFSYCSSLKSVAVPESVTSIGQNAFNSCPALTDVYYAGTSAQWSKISIASNNAPLTNASIHFEKHIHTLTFKAAAASGCTVPGCAVDTYCCTVCGKYFSDADAENELNESDVVIPALGHDYVDAVTAPICTEDGYTTFTCRRCGDSYAANKVPKTGHDLVLTVTNLPTCTRSGNTVYTCSLCGEVFVCDEVPALGHNYADSVTEPTCTEFGSTTHTCSRCGDVYTDTFVPALGHDYSAEVTAPTCTEDGYTTYVCSRCGDTYIADETPATGHSLTTHSATVVAPACTKDGYTVYVCEFCGKRFIGDVTPAAGHDFCEWTAYPDQSCTETNVEYRICASCGETEERSVPAPGHDYAAAVTAPTCTENGYTTHVCSRCGDSYTDGLLPALGHDFANGSCTRCGAADPGPEEGAAVISVRNFRAHPGDKVEIAVDISNDPGVAAAIVWIDFDPDVFLIGDTEDTDGWIIAENGALPALMTVNLNTAGKIGMVFAAGINSHTDGNLVTVVLTVAEDAAPGDYSISVSVPQIKNEDCENVPYRTVNAVASVSNILYGDADGNGAVDLLDVIVLSKYLLNNSEKTGDGADANADGTIDLLDVILVSQYLLDNRVVLGPQG